MMLLTTSKAPHNLRVAFAMSTWKGDFEVREIECKRTAKNIGCTRGCYYVKDVFDVALTLNDDDIFVYANNDVALAEGWSVLIDGAVKLYGCAYAQRIDVPKFGDILTLAELSKVKSYPGMDIFAFTPSWWREHRDDFPDVIFGHEGWDFVAFWSMRLSGFPGNLGALCYHENHQAFWSRMDNLRNDPAQRVNRELCRQWAKVHGAAEWIGDTIYCPFLFRGPGPHDPHNLSTSAGDRRKNLSTSAELFQ